MSAPARDFSETALRPELQELDRDRRPTDRVRVAIDASSAVTGGGITYLRELLPRLAARDDLEIVAVLIKDQARERIVSSETSRLPFVSGHSRFSAAGTLWRKAVRGTCADVVFAPTEVSFGHYRRPLVLLIRNAALGAGNAKEYPWQLRRRLALQRQLARFSARRAAAHIAVSEYAGRLGQLELGVPPKRVHVVHHGGPMAQRVLLPARPARKFLVVSNLYRYKNVHRLIAALGRIDGEWVLDVVGAPLEPQYAGELADLARCLGVSGRVRFRGHLAGRDLQHAYEEADCFVWPAYVETFGHPMLEANSYGLPIIAARAASNEEIAGGAAHYFEPFDVPGLRQVLLKAITEGLPPRPLPRRYSWDKCAAKTGEILRTTALS